MTDAATDFIQEIRLLLEDPKSGTSNRLRDQRRTKMKQLGLIEFDRKAWAWVVLPAGHALLTTA